jgi:hypothetical protein
MSVSVCARALVSDCGRVALLIQHAMRPLWLHQNFLIFSVRVSEFV